MSITAHATLGSTSPPSWGAWIEMIKCIMSVPSILKSPPSWGAWIEIWGGADALNPARRSPPSWGAWIEIGVCGACCLAGVVAPPRGGRGLK